VVEFVVTGSATDSSLEAMSARSRHATMNLIELFSVSQREEEAERRRLAVEMEARQQEEGIVCT
jgi:hypothetical protein